MRILLADDSANMRKIICRVLTMLGYGGDITKGVDGNEVVSLFKPGEFDLVISDWDMPGKTGMEIVKELRAQDADVPIIFIATEAQKRELMNAMLEGASGYVIKPLTAQMLQKEVEKHCFRL